MLRRITFLFALVLSVYASAQERIQDLIYMKSGGAAFTMDVFKPKAPNGAAIIYMVSGGWFSAHENINPQLAEGLNAQGYTVFEVVHGSQPKYTIPEIRKMITRAIRYIHANAAQYGVDPDRLGITGASAGGHLSLFAGGTGDAGNPDARDPIERQPSSVAAVVAYMPPTDFMNYGTFKPKELLTGLMFSPFKAAFGLPANPTDDQLNAIAKAASPIYTVTPKFPPTLLVHGDKDVLVPIQQSEVMLEALKKAGVTSELVTVKGGAHDGVTFAGGIQRMMEWFGTYLKKKG
ncbi:MAG: alpha/beta hydrolase [Armatimonadetes bacterium]|nr:alpha/beta hydrolase [Armatimonadota bacterium]